MIVSASRRTDIPSCYGQWLLNRLQRGTVLVPNPRNPHRIARVNLSPETADCIVLWTKNPIPMLDRLDGLEALGYRFCFQFTLTPYGPQWEPGPPPQGPVGGGVLPSRGAVGTGAHVLALRPCSAGRGVHGKLPPGAVPQAV